MRKFAGALMVSPVTLLPRFNPNAIAEPPLVHPDVLPPQVDVRQMSLFGAAWTLGSIASLSRESSLRSITFYETTGWRGVMEWAERPRLPHKFVTRPGWVFPQYFVFALLADFDECQTVPVSNPLEQAALFVRHREQPSKIRLLLANLTLNELEITLPPGLLAERRLTLDSTNAVAAMREPDAFINHGWLLAPGIRRIRLSPLGLSAVDGRTD